MNRSGLCVVGLVLACGPLPALAAPDQNTASSAYVARAFALTEQGEKAQSPAEALELYRQARAYLDAIPGTYPASRAAAEVVLGGPLEQRVDADIDRATRDVDAWKQALAAGIDQDLAELQRQSGELKPDSTDEEWGQVRQLADSLRERLAQKGAPALDVDPRRMARSGPRGRHRRRTCPSRPRGGRSGPRTRRGVRPRSPRSATGRASPECVSWPAPQPLLAIGRTRERPRRRRSRPSRATPRWPPCATVPSTRAIVARPGRSRNGETGPERPRRSRPPSLFGTPQLTLRSGATPHESPRMRPSRAGLTARLSWRLSRPS